MSGTVEEDFEEFLKREQSGYCLHIRSLLSLSSPTFEIVGSSDDDPKNPTADILSVSPFRAAIYDGECYGLVVCNSYGSKVQYRCMSCDRKSRRCSHVASFLEWAEQQEEGSQPLLESEEESDNEPNYPSVSSQKIPYPLNEIQQELHDRYESGIAFSDHLIPPYQPEKTCIHGNKFNSEDPVISGRVSCHKPIYKFMTSITSSTRKIYYRPTTGDCGCRQEYDGQNNLLFNLDNKHLFYYGFLFSYLHLMVEGKNPLISYLRACQRNHKVLSFTKPASISHLRKAWNTFARLLDVDWSESFQCPLCGPTPHTIVCDGIMIGFWKDFLPEISSSITSTPPIVGSWHQERILISSVKAWSLLLKYSGYTKDRKCLKPHKELSRSEFRELCHLTSSDFPSLSSFLTKLCSDTGKAKSPSEYREFFCRACQKQPCLWNISNSRRAADHWHHLTHSIQLHWYI